MKDIILFINNQADLEAFCSRTRGSAVLAIDTEFMREKTYFARLCLLQMATDDETVIVDPFGVDDLKVLASLFTDESTVKLFHAATQDLEILYREVEVIPHPLFDTQVAAALLGHTQQIGYAALIHAVCGVQLKKADSFTDWSRRPLSNSQLKYAADDVVYLPQAYRKMRESLVEKGRLEWLEPDFVDLSDPARYTANPEERFRKLKRVSSLTRNQLAAAQKLAAWRENSAIRRNIPRKWVLSDEQIVEACKREPRSIDELHMVRGLSDKLSTRDSREVIAAIVAGLDTPKEEWPKLNKGSRSEENVDAQMDLMVALVRLRARQNNIAFQTLASHSDLADLARGHVENNALMRGWRYELIGSELVELLEGSISLSLAEGQLLVTKGPQ